MATLIADETVNPAFVQHLSISQTGNGASTNVVDRGASHKGGVVRIITVVGATPTCTYTLETSTDGTTWVAATYADVSTPTSDSTSTFQITTSTIVQKIIKPATNWRYFRVSYSSNTNVTNTVDFLFSDTKRLP